ncbi:MAG TPA: hypothetical protein VGA36_01870, partial [Nitriliruptorales bacterium]
NRRRPHATMSAHSETDTTLPLRPTTRAWLLASAAWLAGAAAAAGQAEPHVVPDGPEFVVHTTTNFTQHQGRVAMHPENGRFAVTWASVVGSDVYVRLFDADGTPLTGQVLVDDTLSAGIQDEPSVAMDEQGRFLVAWSDRAGYDGFQMGVFARLFDAAGSPTGPEFQVNVQWMQSQWEPFVAARPGGGWVVGWTGTDGGATFMRLLAADGTPQTGEIEVASDNQKQLCPVPAVGRDGTLFFAWIDFDGKAGPGHGTSIFARVFDAAGAPLGPEFQVNTTNAGEQREPKTAADGLGGFVVVWEDRAADAGGIDVHARRYDATGTALGPEFQVNTTTAGDQVLLAVAADWVGNVLYVWEDRSGPDAEVRARRFDAFDQPLSGEFVLPGSTVGNQTQPSVATDWSGQSIVACWTTSGVTADVAVRRWRFDALSSTGTPQLGQVFPIELDLPSGAGLYRLVLMALGKSTGIPLPDGRTLGLDYDLLFMFILTVPAGGGAFTGFSGSVPDGTPDIATIAFPNNPSLLGLPLHIAAVSLDLGAVGLAQQLRHVTRALTIVLQ